MELQGGAMMASPGSHVEVYTSTFESNTATKTDITNGGVSAVELREQAPKSQLHSMRFFV
jgi:hypothetical protein